VPLLKGQAWAKKSPRERRTEDGITFDSLAELTRYRELRLMRTAGEVAWFIRQPKFDLAGAVYTADFLIVYTDGRVASKTSKAQEVTRKSCEGSGGTRNR